MPRAEFATHLPERILFCRRREQGARSVVMKLARNGDRLRWENEARTTRECQLTWRQFSNFLHYPSTTDFSDGHGYNPCLYPC